MARRAGHMPRSKMMVERMFASAGRMPGMFAFAAERAQGRYLRAPDGHGGGNGAPGGEGGTAPADAMLGDDGFAAPSEPTALGDVADAAPGVTDAADAPDAEVGADGDNADSDGDGDQFVPDSYDLAAPDGLTLDADAVAMATPVFRELGLSNDDANKLMPVAARWAQKIQDDTNRAILGQVQADRKAWLDAAQADPETGGNNWAGTLAHAARALDQLGFAKGSPFRILLNDSGLGNHPEMIRAFAKVGQAIGEDSNFIRGTAAIRTKGDAAETLYPDDQPKGA